MAFVIGIHHTKFRRDSEYTHAELAAEALRGALADAGIEPGDVDGIWFGSATASACGQPSVPGVALLGDIVPQGVPIASVDGACATGGLALYGAWLAVVAGQANVAVALGVDLGKVPDVVGLLDSVVMAKQEWEAPPSRHDRERFGRRSARSVGDAAWSPSPERPVLLDVAAVEARYAIRSGAISKADLAAVAAKSRANGALNERAWLRAPITAAQLQAEPSVVDPFVRSMGCALVDGAVAVVVASEFGLARLPSRARAVRLASMATSGGTWRGLGQRPSAERAARRAYSAAGISPERVDVAEVHDANAYAELKWMDALGLASLSEAAAQTRSGQTALAGRRPINPSGGLLSRGHAIAATGLAQIAELVTQLRGEGGPRQIREHRPKIGVAANGGGLVGFDDALSVVSVLRAD